MRSVDDATAALLLETAVDDDERRSTELLLALVVEATELDDVEAVEAESSSLATAARKFWPLILFESA